VVVVQMVVKGVMETGRIGNRGWTIVHDEPHDLHVVGGIAADVDERMGGG
jgi:hypothetical protein